MEQQGFPAGDESSDDEWDLGYSKTPENSNLSVPGPNEDRVSTLKRAINTGDVELVEQLLDNGMDVESRLGFEWTPLMCAVHVANYELAKLLLDRGASANFSRDQYTVLMAACTASAEEDNIARCVELLLSRNADPNACNKSHMTSLMLGARDGYSQVINQLVSHGAEVNTQDANGYTALAMAVQYGKEEAVLKLLQLGADKTIKTKAGKNAAELADMYKRPQISRILASPGDPRGSGEVLSKEETLFKFFKQNPEPPTTTSSDKLCDIELLLHGLNLEYLSDIMLENDITWNYLSTMEKEDFEKIGITDLEDQRKVMSAVQEMHLDRVDMDTFTRLDNIDSSSEELYNFLISLRQQCCYLTETVQDVINRFPKQVSELVLTWDPKQDSQSICADLVTQTANLQKEVTCLRNLLTKMNSFEDPCQLPLPGSHGNWKRTALKSLGLSMLGAGLLLLLSQAKNPKLIP
ncbi:ankyrin repeat, SAM and basic leucine zipper domain-containing protein 1 isoform X1 [Anguilla anguilla]|uniref:ankyrin repeat, SAM and basic leucine zipper domain-containing protein 1 isoform X1 n=1 Tax=Anguilla anguilla TaxID=7936 RepID=UPI0015AC6EB9|nr:ankyrin repeat, SAM and basic leucine zipper domain-containing protein 1 isoform X1 [Anguilla anguilla]